jgi:SpoVK/Ycf46/Vps4 family AAA+-type ATPase
MNLERRIVIPEKFRTVVRAHIWRNALAELTDNQTPTILVISGPPGVGKTFQTRIILEEMGARIFELPSTVFEDKESGRPMKTIMNTYNQASNEYDNRKHPVILIEDADSAIGRGEDVQVTINTQHINGVLREIIDNPKKTITLRGADYGNLTLEKTGIHRVPIIMTCNDSSKIYPPLIRSGRAKLFAWVPSQNDLIKMVKGIFPTLSNSDCGKLVKSLVEYSKKVDEKKYHYGIPISIFQDIKSEMQEYAVIEFSKEHKLSDLFDMTSIPDHLENEVEYAIQDLINVGKTLIQKDVNYLGRGIE